MLVDHDGLVRWAVEREFSGHGMSVLAFGDAATARASLEEIEYRLAIVDFGLADADALDLTQTIRDHSPRTKIIVTGCDAGVEIRHRAYACGASQFVERPFELRVLLDLARSAIETFAERRKHPRRYCRLVLCFGVIDPLPEESMLDLDNLAGETVDVARGGLRLRTPYHLRPAQRVRIRVTSETCDGEAHLPPGGLAHVVWVEPLGHGVTAGLRFDSTTTPARTS